MSNNRTGQVVEMSWDPITRIIGSLGIHTKIDFGTRRVIECHATSSILGGIVCSCAAKILATHTS
jgi:hydrogenase large subunit